MNIPNSSEKMDEKHHNLERYCGMFQRVYQVPVSVQADKIEVASDKRALKITLFIAEDAKTKEIKITVK